MNTLNYEDRVQLQLKQNEIVKFFKSLDLAKIEFPDLFLEDSSWLNVSIYGTCLDTSFGEMITDNLINNHAQNYVIVLTQGIYYYVRINLASLFAIARQTIDAGKYENKLSELKAFTVDCRANMHEPDEQDISVSIIGTVFDSSRGEEISISDIENINQTMIVILKRDNIIMRINLATLFEIACKAQL